MKNVFPPITLSPPPITPPIIPLLFPIPPITFQFANQNVFPPAGGGAEDAGESRFMFWPPLGGIGGNKGSIGENPRIGERIGERPERPLAALQPPPLPGAWPRQRTAPGGPPRIGSFRPLLHRAGRDTPSFFH